MGLTIKFLLMSLPIEGMGGRAVLPLGLLLEPPVSPLVGGLVRAECDRWIGGLPILSCKVRVKMEAPRTLLANFRVGLVKGHLAEPKAETPPLPSQRA